MATTELLKAIFLMPCRDLPADPETETFFKLLMESVPHLDEPALSLRDERGTKAPAQATGQSGAQAKVTAGAPAAAQKPADRPASRGKPAGNEDKGRRPKSTSSAPPQGEALTRCSISHTSVSDFLPRFSPCLECPFLYFRSE